MLDIDTRVQTPSVFNALDVGVILLDRQLRIVIWNEWIARASGLAETAVIGKNFYEVFPASRDTRLQSAIEDCFESGSSSILTHSLNKARLPLRGVGGEDLLHDVIVRIVSTDQTEQCLLQINDVTVAVTRDRVLRERQNARYHAIVETAPDAIITVDSDHTIQWLNGVAEKTFGYPASELLGRKIDVLLDNQSQVDALSLGRGSKISGKQTALRVAGRTKHGVVGYFEVSNAPWKSTDRVFITTIWREVTERLAAEQALRESEARLRGVLEALPQLVWTCGPDGACDYLNPQWQIYTGGAPSEYVGAGWLEIIHQADRPEFESAWNEALSLRVVFDIEARLRRHDATYRWFKLRATPMREAGSPVVRWFGTATDIDDLIDARDRLRSSNEELESRVAERTREREVALAQLFESQKMETIGQLTGGVAHDFNNLLAVIIGSLTLLKKSIPEHPRTARLLDGALQGAERGATLTKRLLAFARRQELKLDAVDLRTLIPDMLDFLRQSVGPNVHIETDVASDTKPVLVDVNQLELALMNLVVNSRDAMPKGGSLTIACRNANASGQRFPKGLPDDEYVCLSVTDTGEGMSQATVARAMDPFFTTKGIGKGTGLGLSMVHGMTAQTGGTVDIQSELGKGTAITLWLPQAHAEAPTNQESQVSVPEVPADRKLRILVVDDDALVSMNTAYMLMDLGHTVLEAHSAAQALQMLETDSAFDLVITDYAMPGMNGFDLATAIRKHGLTMPVILASGYAEFPDNVPVDLPRLGKPYAQEELRRALQVVLGNDPG